MISRSRCIALAAILLLMPQTALAAASLPGAAMPWPWALPFAGILLSIATGPLLFTAIWHRHYGKIAFGWAMLTLLPLAAAFGAETALAAFVHAALAEYLSFIVLLFALYVVAGGILVTGDLRGTPWINAGILAFGTAIASLVGTTGAAMILIRPLIRANAWRARNAHVVIFFIILVANIGGALTPLGDPPLFVGFLRGVEFTWTARHLWLQTAIVALLVLAIFFALDVWMARADKQPAAKTSPAPNEVHGLVNIALIGLIILAILVSATWKPAIAFDVYGTHVELQNMLRDAALILIALASLWLTANEHRASQRLHLRADPRGRHPVRRHFRRHHSGDGDAASRPRRQLRVPAAGRDGARRQPARGGLFLAHRRAVGASSTMRRPIWCSSSSPAATPGS